MPLPTLSRFAVNFALLALIAPLANGQAVGDAQLNLPRVELSAGMHRIDAQVARAPVERQVGLMHRRSMPVHEGMLFVFEKPEVQCFWMKNTLIPLSAAFLADDGTVVNLEDMKPESIESHCSSKPVRFVLEMNQGWFKARSVKAGSKIAGPVFAGARSTKR